MTTPDTENDCRECEGEGGYDTCKGGQASWVECDHCDGTGKVDDYGNPFSGDRIIYCCFPDCGCDGARLCQAENGTMADQFPDATKMATLSDRIARALCSAMAPDRDGDGARPCSTPCATCRDGAAAAAHEIADHFSELYGGASNTADALYAVGSHQAEPQAGWQPINPGKEAMALAVGRELRRPDA